MIPPDVLRTDSISPRNKVVKAASPIIISNLLPAGIKSGFENVKQKVSVGHGVMGKAGSGYSPDQERALQYFLPSEKKAPSIGKFTYTNQGHSEMMRTMKSSPMKMAAKEILGRSP